MTQGVSPSQRKTERQMNLMFVLLNAGVPRTKSRLRQEIPGYDEQSDEAFDRMFERDKQALRDIGIPIESVPLDEGGYEDYGYRIKRSEWLIPPLNFDSQDRILLSLAARAWGDSGLAQAAKSGLSGLTDEQNFGQLLPRLGHRQPNLGAIAQAITTRMQIRFSYRTADGDEVRTRNLDPWRLILNRGIWNFIGWDYLRNEQRSFRLTRIVGDIEVTKTPVANSCPPDLDVVGLVAKWNSLNSEYGTAQIVTEPAKAPGLRLLAREVSADGTKLTVDYDDELELARLIARECDAARVESPDSLAATVKQILTRTKEVHA
jgi:predicted DNA-binding transcriptional regulator YafY